MGRAAQTSLYEVLEVTPAASRDQIEASYRRIVGILGPQSLAMYAMLDDDETERLRAQLDEAYQTLTDPDRRAAYDRSNDGPPMRYADAMPERDPHGDEDEDEEGPADPPPRRLEAVRQRESAAEAAESSRGDAYSSGRPPAAAWTSEGGSQPGVRSEGAAASARPATAAWAGEVGGPSVSRAEPPASASRPVQPGGWTADTPPKPAQQPLPPPRPGQSTAWAADVATQAATAALGEPPPRPRTGPPPRASRVVAPQEGKRRRLQTQLNFEVGPDTEFSGSLLRRLRESADATLEELADITKISKRYLAALEENDFASLPAFVYVRGFVCEYARALGLDPKIVAGSYMALYRRYREGG